MKKRFVVVMAVSLLGLATLLSFASASAASPSMGERIWCGLWAGTNFNFSLDAANCKPRPVDTAPPTQPPVDTKPTYVALGDSVAAGLGLAGSASNTCGRSTGAYSTQVASTLQMRMQNYACSGATAGDLFTAQHITGPNPPAQLRQAFQNGEPDLITITAGANDARWADFIKACYATDCATSTNTRIANALLTALQAKLHYALYSIQARSDSTPPQVILTGYYQPLSPACSAVQSQLTPQEISWLSAETAALNQTIQQVAAHYSFAKFAPVNFAGHDMCSADSWIQGANDPAPFHPTAQGQAAIAQAVLQATSKNN